jgi:hypothetical protein
MAITAKDNLPVPFCTRNYQWGMPCESGIPPKNPKADYSVIKNIDSGK